MIDYKTKAKNARLKVLDMVYKAQSSHIGSNFSVIDIFTVLFEKADLSKDKIILSAGWKAASFYYFLAEKGVIPKEDLDTYCQPGSKLIGLTEPGIPGVLFAGGSMGLGFPAAVGFALSKKLKKEPGMVYCVMSDGELAIGTIWESALIAAHHNLDNLMVIVDQNGFQAMGKSEDILINSFPDVGWGKARANGHSYEELKSMISGWQEVYTKSKPLVLFCKTVKGKGVSFMENQNVYHYKNLSFEEYEIAKMELSVDTVSMATPRI